jgi:hypothetical protein
MTDQALRARTVSELVDATFTLYRRDASSYIMVTAIASVPGLLTQLFIKSPAFSSDLGAVSGAFIGAVISMITYALMTGVVMRVGSDVYLGGHPDVAGAVRAVMPKVGTLIAVAIGRSILFFLGALAFGVGILYVGARWFAPEAVVVLEEKGFGPAFSRCSELSAGRKWHILKALALGYGIYFVMMIGVVSGAAVLGSETAVLFASTLFTVIAYPIIGLLTMLLYYDARIRGEGFDVEHLARSLGGGSHRS